MSKADRRRRRDQRRANREDRRTGRRTQRASNRDARREDREDRISARGKNRTDRITARKSAKIARIDAKQASGYWSPEAVQARSAAFGGAVDDISDFGSDVLGAIGFGKGEPDQGDAMSAPSAEDYTGANDPFGAQIGGQPPYPEDEIPLTEQPWFMPAVGIAAVGAVYYMTQKG